MATDRQRGNEVGRVARHLGENVAQRRADLGLSARELADRLTENGRRFTMSSIQKIERAERRVDVDDLQALADALGVSVSRLLKPGIARGETSINTGINLMRSIPGLGRAVYFARTRTHFTEAELMDLVSMLFHIATSLEDDRLQLEALETRLAATDDPTEAAHLCRESGFTSLDIKTHADVLFSGRAGFADSVRQALSDGA